MTNNTAQINAKLIAYYLPQFHPIPENDLWWGKGYTEWTNVGKARPLFRGHYQPRIPADLGYYDLRLADVREKQAELAKDAGVYGFMYWHYWFGNGKRVLEMPLNEVISSGKPDFPFCLGWANHSWRSDLWKSNDKIFQKNSNMIFEQIYPGVKDYIDHFYSMLPAFTDDRYIKVNNKLLFLVYNPLEIPDCKLFIETWNNLAIKNGLDGFHFIGQSRGWSSEVEDILSLGFEAVNRNSQWEAECKVKGKYTRILIAKFLEKVGGINLDTYEYEEIVNNLFNKYDELENVYPTVIPQWDRSPRSGKQAIIYKNSTPEKFQTHLLRAIEIIKNKSEENKIIFLKSWNEWGEGNYVEPDLRFGHEYLNSVKECIFRK